MTVAILITAPDHADYERARQLASDIREKLIDLGAVAHLASEVGTSFSSFDLVIVVGGDGEVIHALSDFSPRDTPVFGVNGGNVGFLTAANADTLDEALQRIVAKNYVVEHRSALEFEYKGTTYGPFVNEIELWHPESLMHYDVQTGDHQIYPNCLYVVRVALLLQEYKDTP